MALISNQVFKLLHDTSSGSFPAGIYRVIFDDVPTNKVVCVCIQMDDSIKVHCRGRKKMEKTKQPRKKRPPCLIGELWWMERDYLAELEDRKLLIPVVIEREPIYFVPIQSPKDQEIFSLRCNAMAGFLDLVKLKESILANAGLGGLVRETTLSASVSRSYVYKQWSTLCRLGLSEISLRPRRDRCGAPGLLRPCDSGGRQKAGKKTRTQKVALSLGVKLPPKQPGMNTEWRAAIHAADNQIKTAVKPVMSKRCALILDSHFVKRYRQENGVLVAVDPSLGEYPNNRQIRRVLERDISRLQRLLEKTTTGHFNRSLRGLTARNWKGVSGPGHTWAIDSTVGDIYLRSSINRAWIVGRPIVYIVVDVWSTAVVGFYVCLTGPSWKTAKVSLFNSVVDPNLLGEIWGYRPMLSLSPFPTMCFKLLCDRGEYLSKAASITAAHLISDIAYTPPYRPDLKGLVEVIHRIEKDKQFLFNPGAMDARRAEFDLRKSHPEESAMTVREYVEYLHLIFAEYNLTANRMNRLDVHMAAAGVYPSPAGLWRWGHEMGIGVQREFPQDDLITKLLEPEMARVGRSSIVFAGNDYSCPTIRSEEWTTLARNGGGWNISIYRYPGPVGRIWTPNVHGQGLLELKISDQAKTSAEVTFDEMLDAHAIVQMQHPENEHQKTMLALESQRKVTGLLHNAIKLTKEAEKSARGARPTMTEARHMEVAGVQNAHGSEKAVAEKLRDEAMEAHEEMMHAMLHALLSGEDGHV